MFPSTEVVGTIQEISIKSFIIYREVYLYLRDEKNILITGATGHLGSFLLGRIPKNYNIFT